jgi:hypothetical protein
LKNQPTAGTNALPNQQTEPPEPRKPGKQRGGSRDDSQMPGIGTDTKGEGVQTMMKGSGSPQGRAARGKTRQKEATEAAFRLDPNQSRHTAYGMILEMIPFFVGLFLISASTLIYEVVLTRLLSVVTWYYLAFVSVSIAMFGLTAGALLVQFLPEFFAGEHAPKRMAQAVLAAAIAMPLSLMTMLAVPVAVVKQFEGLYSFLFFSAVISVPFFFAGIAICLSLTRAPFPIGRIYFADLAGAAAGCLGSIGLMSLLDAPSAIFAISAITFVSAAMYFLSAGDRKMAKWTCFYAVCLGLFSVINANSHFGIRPMWEKGKLNDFSNILAEVWNPISRVRASQIQSKQPQLWGGSPNTPEMKVDEIWLNIDGDAETPVTRYAGNPASLDFLRYDVTSVAAQLRPGGTAAIIGLGGGRDALNCLANGYQRIVGIEMNSAMINLDTQRFASFSGFSQIPQLEIHHDEGRNYLTRTSEHFDLIQASMVDTWAANAAGAMTLSENALYTVDGWHIFYRHLKPGGLVTFSRWYTDSFNEEISRLFAVAWATLLEEGVKDPGDYIAIIRSGPVATLILSNRPFSPADLAKIKSITETMGFKPLYLSGEPTQIDQLRVVAQARTTADLAHLRSASYIDYSPVYDSSPYFFNSVHLVDALRFMSHLHAVPSSVLAMFFVIQFMIAAGILVAFTIVAPTVWWGKRHACRPPPGGIVYFIAIGIGFMLVEMAMMQQLTILLGQPIYSLIVVIAGLILSSGLGSLTSDALKLRSRLESRLPALAVVVILAGYSVAVLPMIHSFIASVLAVRVLVAFLLVAFPGYLMGFCFPIGLRWLKNLGEERNLPWMWALNGAAGTLGSFIAIVISMDTSITICGLTGAGFYLLAAAAVPGRRREADPTGLAAIAHTMQGAS